MNFFKTLFIASSKQYFTGKDNGLTIEEYIKQQKSAWEKNWRDSVWFGFKYEAYKWYFSLDDKQLTKLSDAEFEKVLLDKWSRARKKENEPRKGLFPTGIFLLQVHRLIQKEKIMVSISPSCKHNFISVNLAKKLQVPAKQIEHTRVLVSNLSLSPCQSPYCVMKSNAPFSCSLNWPNDPLCQSLFHQRDCY